MQITKQTAAMLSIVSNSLLIILKIIAGILMCSVSVLSEALHSAIDLVASLVAWIAIRKALQPADEQHPFGHGKFENVSGFFEAMLIFFAAGMIIYEAVQKLFHPMEVAQLNWGIGVMAVSALANTLVSRMLLKISKRTGSIALEADAMHLSVDVYTSLSVMAGLALIKITHWNILDPIIAIGVAAMICKASFDLTKKTIRDLVDEQLPEDEIDTIKTIISSESAVLAYHKLRTRKSGHYREIDIHIVMAKNLELEQAHALCTSIEDRIKKEFPESNITIHAEPEESV